MVRDRLAADLSGIARQGAGAVFARTLCKLSEKGRYRAGLRSARAECRDRGLWHALSHCGRYVAACGPGCVSGTQALRRQACRWTPALACLAGAPALPSCLVALRGSLHQLAPVLPNRRSEIGRALCGEVCQYVEISVGALTFKKKNQ